MPVKDDALISLLLEELPLEAFEAALRELAERARSGGLNDEQVTERLVTARTLRRLLDRYKSRANELSALFDTAGDLSSVRDLEMVLQAIARRARHLLGTDVAYLMLLDNVEGDAYMRVTAGTVTSGFAGIRLALGAGLGGLVAQTGSPHWTANYLEDKRYSHDIDAVVEDESLLAILGVPLKVAGRVIGVLFAADRTARSFGRDEISLLSSLAAHAAIAIENAAHFEEAQSALARLAEAMTTIAQHNEALERAALMHERLTKFVLADRSHPEIARTLAASFGGGLFIFDSSGRVLASHAADLGLPWDQIRDGGSVDADAHAQSEVSLLLAEAGRTRRPARGRVRGVDCSAVPVLAGTRNFGWLVHVGPALTEADLRAFERAATVTALLQLNAHIRDDAENRVRGELLTELLTSPVHDVDAFVRRAALVDVDLEGSVTVAVLLPAEEAALSRVRIEATAIARSEKGLLGFLPGRVVLLLPRTDAAALATSLPARLAERGFSRFTIGVAGPAKKLDDVAMYEAEAARCAKTLLLLRREGEGATARQLGAFGLLLAGAHLEHVQTFADALLAPIDRYDNERGTSLVETLGVYFASNCSVVKAAAALFVHSNTLYQRLERVDQLLGADWREPDHALEIQLALRLRQLGLAPA